MLQTRRFSAGLLGLALWTMAALADTTPAAKPATNDDAKWLLSNAEVVVKFNIKQMLGSELMKGQGVDMIKDLINSEEQVKTLLNAAGLDVTKDVDSILASVSGSNPADAKMRVVIKGRFDPAKVQSVIEKNHREIKISKEGATNLFEIPVSDQNLFAAFVDKNTLVLTESKDSTVDAIKSAGKRDATMNKQMQTALSRFSGKESMTMVMVITDEIKQGLAAIPGAGESIAKLQTVTASITVTNEVDVSMRGNTSDAKAAAQLKQRLESLKALGQAAGDEVPKVVVDIIEAIKIVSDNDSVKVDLKVTKEQIEKATKGG